MSKVEDSVRAHIAKLNPIHLKITDFSDSCGLKLNVEIVSEEFEGKKPIQQHRMVHNLLNEEMKNIHALTLTTLTPKQWHEKQGSPT
ncbi:unnamed protein product [Mesocestoides corti]|uniref:BolA-like protein n=1 Tax=Mesocestoides corti TaxID=53468 RepID=A0A0R3U3V7_MESCO|nr:unnamed protein product [Mesocestoides corti]